MMNKTHGPIVCKVHRVVPVYLVKLAGNFHYTHIFSIKLNRFTSNLYDSCI